MCFKVLGKKEIEFLKEKHQGRKARFGRRTPCSTAESGSLLLQPNVSSAAERGRVLEAPLASEGGLASHL